MFCSPSPKWMESWLSESSTINLQIVGQRSKNQTLMNWTTASMDLNDDQTRTRSTDLNQFIIRGGKSLYKSTRLNTGIFFMATSSLSIFPIPSSWSVSYIIQLPLDYLDPTLIDHLSLYLYTCPIRHLIWLSVSCDNQDNTVQRSSPHKCSQKSSCSAFNTVVAVFLEIFLGSAHSHMFMMHILIIGVSWKVTLIIGIHI